MGPMPSKPSQGASPWPAEPCATCWTGPPPLPTRRAATRSVRFEVALAAASSDQANIGPALRDAGWDDEQVHCRPSGRLK